METQEYAQAHVQQIEISIMIQPTIGACVLHSVPRVICFTRETVCNTAKLEPIRYL